MYERILVPVDGSATSNAGLDEAIELARLTKGRLRLIHSVEQQLYLAGVEGMAGLTADVSALLTQGGEKILAACKARVDAAGVPVETHLFDNFFGRISDLVAEDAVTWRADLIVVGTHGRRGIRRAMLGSDAEQILRNAPVPVLLVRGHEAAA